MNKPYATPVTAGHNGHDWLTIQVLRKLAQTLPMTSTTTWSRDQFAGLVNTLPVHLSPQKVIEVAFPNGRQDVRAAIKLLANRADSSYSVGALEECQQVLQIALQFADSVELPWTTKARLVLERVLAVALGIVRFSWDMSAPVRSRMTFAQKMIALFVTSALIVVSFGWVYYKVTLPGVPEAAKHTGTTVVIPPKRTAVPMTTVSQWSPADWKFGFNRSWQGGSARQPMTDQQKQLRVKQMLSAMDFATLRTTVMVKGIAKVAALDEPAEKAVRQFLAANPKMASSFEQQLGLPRENLTDFLLALIWRESQGNWSAVSPTGPVGPGQFTEDTGRRMGLVGERLMENDPKTNKPVFKGKFSFEYRNDPLRVIPAMLELLKLEYQRYNNRWDLAVFAYHSGDPRVDGVVNAAKSENLQWQSYDDLFFVDPVAYPRTHKAVQNLMDGQDNYGPTYWYGTRRAMELLWLYWQDADSYQRLADAQRKQDSEREVKYCRGVVDARLKGDRAEEDRYRKLLGDSEVSQELGGDPESRFWAGYSCRDLLQLITTQDLLQTIRRGELVDLPSGSFNLNLRPASQHGIGERAGSEGADAYQKLSKESWGMFILIASHYHRLRPGSKDLELTSLVRTWAYQMEVRNTALPTHTIRIAGDISKKGLSAEDLVTLRFVMNEMMYSGILSFIDEGDHYHVVLMPNDAAKAMCLYRYQFALDHRY